MPCLSTDISTGDQDSNIASGNDVETMTNDAILLPMASPSQPIPNHQGLRDQPASTEQKQQTTLSQSAILAHNMGQNVGDKVYKAAKEEEHTAVLRGLESLGVSLTPKIAHKVASSHKGMTPMESFVGEVQEGDDRDRLLEANGLVSARSESGQATYAPSEGSA
ncbi:hypothetical protein CMUS01_04936 [Colletotrichum musicola]|uniref:Uncharacterized protein n=1 Tax=Colletotrichum musicola TaxID=2175873 RepID=A0A8H6KUR5_9PEZI|nr:hypothetical protein CMUS01_04936 [Colletotrichum musicola]